MKKAIELLKQYEAIFDDLATSNNKFRFGRGMVSISDVAQQYYCEKALHLNYEHPLEPTEGMMDGVEGHENITTLAIPVTREEAIRDALKKRKKAICIYEFGVGWKYKDVPILGRADEVWFRGGHVDLIAERKFTDALRPYRTYHVQARLYCLGLGEMGFDTSSTNYSIMVFKRDCFDCPNLVLRSCPIFTHNQTSFQCDRAEVMTFTYPFSRDDAIAELDWALNYWLGLRDAIPSKNHAKCRVCRQKSRCEFALA